MSTCSIQAEESTSITEDAQQVHHWKRQNLLLEIPSRQSDVSSPEFVGIKMPPTTPSPTPRRVNFLVTPDATVGKTTGSPGPSSSIGKSSIKSLFPKLSFKYRTSSDIEKGDNLALDPSASGPREKPAIVRSLSFTKLFTPKINRTSSLPVNQLLDSNPESTPSGSVGGTPNRIVSFPDIIASVIMVTDYVEVELKTPSFCFIIAFNFGFLYHFRKKESQI